MNAARIFPFWLFECVFDNVFTSADFSMVTAAVLFCLFAYQSVSIQFCLLHLTTSVLFDTRLNSYADRPYFIANRHSNSNRCQHFWYGLTHIPTCSNRKKTKIHEKRINNVMCQYSIVAANTDTRNRKRAMLCSMNITHTHVVKAHNLQKTSNMSMQDHLVVV